MVQQETAQNTKSLKKDVFPFIVGQSADIPHSGGFAFNNLKALTDGSLQDAFPEYYDGCRPGELNPSVREQLGEYIVPSSDTTVSCLPTFFTEIIGLSGHIRIGERPLRYAGALGARAVHHLRCFINGSTPTAPEAFDNNAYVLTALYWNMSGMLCIYAVHPIPPSPSPPPPPPPPPPSSSPSSAPQNPAAAASSSPPPQNRRADIEYRMTLIDRRSLTISADTFRDGIRAYRNAREWAKEKRDELVAAANAKVEREREARAQARASA